MRKILLALSLFAIVAAVAVVINSDDSSAEICDDVNVYILNEDDTYTKSTVSNVQTVREAINREGRSA